MMKNAHLSFFCTTSLLIAPLLTADDTTSMQPSVSLQETYSQMAKERGAVIHPTDWMESRRSCEPFPQV